MSSQTPLEVFGETMLRPLGALTAATHGSPHQGLS